MKIVEERQNFVNVHFYVPENLFNGSIANNNYLHYLLWNLSKMLIHPNL